MTPPHPETSAGRLIRDLVEALADQQAMPDDWWRPKLDAILEAHATRLQQMREALEEALRNADKEYAERAEGILREAIEQALAALAASGREHRA